MCESLLFKSHWPRVFVKSNYFTWYAFHPFTFSFCETPIMETTRWHEIVNPFFTLIEGRSWRKKHFLEKGKNLSTFLSIQSTTLSNNSIKSCFPEEILYLPIPTIPLFCVSGSFVNIVDVLWILWVRRQQPQSLHFLISTKRHRSGYQSQETWTVSLKERKWKRSLYKRQRRRRLRGRRERKRQRNFAWMSKNKLLWWKFFLLFLRSSFTFPSLHRSRSRK